nr:hypothetical protein [Lentilactobacillus sp. SPB1-3]
GGIASYATTQDANDAKADGKTAYKLASTSTTENTTLFAQPAWSQYKVGRAKAANGSVISSTAAYKDATFTLNKAVTTSREGETWYQIGSTNADLNGAYVKASDVVAATPAETPIAQNQVGIKFIDADTGKQVGSTLVKTNNSYLTVSAPSFVNSLGLSTQLPTGYTDANVSTGINGLTDSQTNANKLAISNAQYGNTVNYYVKNIGTANYFKNSSTAFMFKSSKDADYTADNKLNKDALSFNTVKDQSLSSVVSALSSDANTVGANGGSVSLSAINAALKAQGADSFYIIQVVGGPYVTSLNDLSKLDSTQALYIQKLDFNSTDFAKNAAPISNTQNTDGSFKIDTSKGINLPYSLSTRQVTAGALKSTSTTVSDVATAFANSTETIN